MNPPAACSSGENCARGIVGKQQAANRAMLRVCVVGRCAPRGEVRARSKAKVRSAVETGVYAGAAAGGMASRLGAVRRRALQCSKVAQS